jgi:Fe-S cluster assembly protein SufD
VLEGDAEWFGFLREGAFGQGSIVNDVVVQVTGNRLLRCDAISSKRDAQIRAGTVNAASSQVKLDVRHWLPEPGASLQVNGSILASRKDHLDSHVEILHSGKQTFSRLEWHTAASGESVTTGTGMLRIDAGAKGGDAGQLFQNLLLSDKAKANSIPELEVMESEVVGCGHGTANGPLDEYQMFYLNARGFDEEQARAALIAAFLNAPLSNMGSESLHGWLINRIESHLSGL